MLIKQVVDEQGNVLREEVIEEQSPWMTIQEAAQFLRKTDHTIHEYHRTFKPDGKRVLQKYRIGDFQTILVKRADVEALVQPVIEDEPVPPQFAAKAPTPGSLVDFEDDAPAPAIVKSMVDFEDDVPAAESAEDPTRGPHGTYPSTRVPAKSTRRATPGTGVVSGHFTDPGWAPEDEEPEAIAPADKPFKG